MTTVDLGVGSGGLGFQWEEAIARVRESYLIAYSHGSRDELGRVAGGWCGPRGAEVWVLVGKMTTVWDEEIVGVRLVLET